MTIGFLTDSEIKRKKDDFFPRGDFDKNQANGSSYDLSLGDEVYVSGEEYPRKLSPHAEFVNLPRGQFALLMTHEYIKIPENHLGLISIRFGLKAKGLINISGFHVDPGFEGKIVFSVFNAGPADVILRYRDAIFMIFFYELQGHVDKPYDGKMKGQEHLPISLVTSLKGTAASLTDVDKRVSRLETANRIYISLLIALTVGVIGIALKVIFGGG